MNGKEKNLMIQLVGWYGVAAILIAYLLLNLELLSVESLAYLLLNLTGAIAIMTDAWYEKNYQPVVLNVVWALVAIWGIIRFFV